MPSLGRDKGRSRSRRSDDEFVIFLQGIPPHCRWQELKDLVRQTALHIRQAVVYDDSHGFPTGLGQIIVKNEDEAWRTYHRLSTSGWDGQSLVVTLSRTSTPTQPIAGPTRSPSMMPASYISGQSTPPLVHGNIAMPPSPVSPDATPPSPVMNGTMYDPHWNMMPGYQMSPPHHMHHISGDNQPQNYQHYYPGAKATNSSSPYFSPDRRAITIENLNSTTTCADLKTLLQTAGTVQKCSIVATDSVDQSGQLRGLITMQTAEEAQGAVTMFNNLSFMGSRIRVKVDRGSHLARSVSFDGVCAGSDTAGSVPENGDTCQSWADEMTAEANAVDNCKPLVIDGSGLNRAGEGLSTSAPT
ncbi:Nucleotide-binding alpha-beta plait [Penicillium expansum]|nr:Nucleotide-binding alpha-beta plait [Penicillium expansum]